MKSIGILLLLILVMPIFCSIESRENIIRKSKKNIKEDETVVKPSSPLHLSGNWYNSRATYGLYVTDGGIYLIKRGKDYYEKMVFTYTKKIENDITTLSDIKLDENNSKFLFSSDDNLDGCNAEYGKEYSYKELKQKCSNGVYEIERVIDAVKQATQISCIQEEEGQLYTICRINTAYVTYLNEYQSLDEINYKLDNLQIKTYSPSTTFCGKTTYDNLYMVIEDNKMMKVSYDDYFFYCTYTNITVKDEGNYTKVDGDYDYYLLCLESNCKYICRVYSWNYDDNWRIYTEPCYKKVSDFNTFFNHAYTTVYNNAKKYDPSKPSLRRSLLEEKDSDNDKKESTSKGYYYEDVQKGGYGYYKGYFVIDNILTIIEQTSANEQSGVVQLKLVLKLDEENKSLKLENIYDDEIDQEKSGVEPKYSDDYTDKSCKSFIPLKDSSDKYSTCSVHVGDLTYGYTKREYNITGSGSNTKLTIHKLDGGNENDGVITLAAYDSTKLNEIINNITKFTTLIPENNCLKNNITDGNSGFKTSLYNKVFYSNMYVENEMGKTLTFGYKSYDGYWFYFNIDKLNYRYANIGDNQYITGENKVFYHKYVDFKGNKYEECNEDLKNDVLNEFTNRINAIKKEQGIDDGSVEYIVNIFLISLLFIIFI